MSVFRKDFLERIKSSKASGVSQQDLKCTSKTVSPQQMACLEAAIKQQRIEREKGGWRPAAKWLEQNCEEYRQPSNGEVSNATNGTRSSILSPNSEPANEPPTCEPQPLTNAPESQSAPAALPSPSPIQLPSAFWQALLYGSPDALLSPRDANTALRLVACELGKDSDVVLFTDTVRGQHAAQDVGSAVRSKSVGCYEQVVASNSGQSRCARCERRPEPISPGVKDCPRSMPAWRREFHQEISNEQRLLESFGGWCG
jgi:hypothetical protein